MIQPTHPMPVRQYPPRATQYPLVLELMGGLGDNIYARPFVRAWSAGEARGPCWLYTPWPQLFTDLPVGVIKPSRMGLRVQRRNIDEQPPGVWSSPGPRADRRRLNYCLAVPGESVIDEIERGVGWPAGQPFVFDLPDFGPSPVTASRVAVVRPTTLRREWSNAARNPDPAYPARAATLLREAGYHVVVVADIDERAEPLLGELPEGDTNYLHGELCVTQLLALVQHAAVVVGGPGWIVPAAVATRTPLVVIAGGQAAHNGPSVLIDQRMDASRVRWILPDDYCQCRSMQHDCAKGISHFRARFIDALDELDTSSTARAA